MTELDKNKEASKANAENEIEITPAMIEAGAEALSFIDLDRLFFRSDPEISQEVVCAIYVAMAKISAGENDRIHSPSEKDPQCG